ncbi:MAG: protein phosphatase CheZ [Pseudohongiellaceae bacterium]|nr:protein phosphatase CheZ [Pseudohongiellaceae bacterium]
MADNKDIDDKATELANEEALTGVLKERTKLLLEKLDEGDINAANSLIQDINSVRDETLYLEVGRLTRGLHNAIRDFHLDIGLDGKSKVKNEIEEISESTSRLNYVIELTEDAANTTMDMVEASLPVVDALTANVNELKADWEMFRQLKSEDPDVELMYKRVDKMMSGTMTDASTLHNSLNEILMAQGYQDLSGQVIKRVIALVSDVENSLVRLVKLASNVEAVAGLSAQAEAEAAEAAEANIDAEGPQMKDSKNDVVSGQDDVDALLSSLGF